MPASDLVTLSYSRLMHIILIAMLFLFYIILFLFFFPDFTSSTMLSCVVGALVMIARVGLWWVRGYVSFIGTSFFLSVATIFFELLCDAALSIWTVVNIFMAIFSGFALNMFFLRLLLIALHLYMMYKLTPVVLVVAMGASEERSNLLLVLSPVESASAPSLSSAPPRPPPPSAYRA